IRKGLEIYKIGVIFLAGKATTANSDLSYTRVYGSTKKEVRLYVKMYHDSLPLMCMTEEYSQKELIDPSFMWTGPQRTNLKGEPHVTITDTGKLTVHTFEKSMSGSYSCTLSHKTIDRKKEFLHVSYLLLDVVLAYHEPDYCYKFVTRYSTKKCQKPVNSNFFKKMKSIIKRLVVDLTCVVTDVKMECHVVKMPRSGLRSLLFISFKVHPFGHGWKATCKEFSSNCENETNERVQKARDRFEKFFSEQSNMIRDGNLELPPVYYVESSLEITLVDSCQPGFGKDPNTYSDCKNCCVVCSPQTYSSSNEQKCSPCNSINVTSYGATAC
uniref:Zona pellucida binding protein 2 n=1 Tax=Latimeria chalumnae TaxID=7897 RepID=H3AX50_LATCH